MFADQINLSWQDRANCKELDTNLFYVERGQLYDKRIVEACNSCPVQSECLMYALHHEYDGYWGGTSGRQRENMRRELGITVHVPGLKNRTDITRSAQKDQAELLPCGTTAAYMRHVRNNETPCTDCRRAWSDYKKDAYFKSKSKVRDLESI